MTVRASAIAVLCAITCVALTQIAQAYGITSPYHSDLPIDISGLPPPQPYIHPNLYKVQLANIAVLLGSAYLLGLLVRHLNWQVGYTRKSLAAVLYLAPFQIGAWWYVDFNVFSLTVSCVTFALCLAVMAKPFRSRIPFLATAFACIDRPGDRPFTLLWLLTSVAATWAILLIWTLALPNTIAYMVLALFISGVSDAVAEPVGLAFGRHTYATRALWTDKRYTRSLEGSASVYLTTLLGVFYVNHAAGGFGGPTEFLLTLALFPVVATLVEAKSPHTWDQPFLIASGGLTAVFIQFVA